MTGTKGGRRAWTMDPPFRDSQLVRPAGAEVTVDQVGRPHRRGIGDRGSPWLAATLSALDGRLAHQALDVVATDRLPGPEHRLPRASVATGLVVGGVDLADAAEQPLVVNGPGRAPASGALAQASSGTRPREPRKRLRANGVREPFGTRAWYPLRFQPRAQRWRSTKKCSPSQAALGAGATGLEPATSGVTETPRSADPGGMRVANAGIVRLGRFDQARWVPIWYHARDALGEGGRTGRRPHVTRSRRTWSAWDWSRLERRAAGPRDPARAAIAVPCDLPVGDEHGDEPERRSREER
ncbi:MAG: hypothetical protein QOK21_151 [Solirubrobacteraceae bacterium]|nr:hypothetical protein [Solirubrobacteraceae bacterium]